MIIFIIYIHHIQQHSLQQAIVWLTGMVQIARVRRDFNHETGLPMWEYKELSTELLHHLAMVQQLYFNDWISFTSLYGRSLMMR